MFLNLLFSSLIAVAAITPSPTPSTTIAQMQNQSVTSNPSSAVELAAKSHRFWFRLYVTWIVLAAIASAFLTWMLWRSGNRQQDAAISETKEHTAKLEKEAAEAHTKQTEAELSLLKLQRFVREPRIVDPAKSKAFLEGRAKGSVELMYLDGNIESERLANELQKLLSDSGWRASIKKADPELISYAGISVMTGSKMLQNVGTGAKLGRPEWY